ncbi:DNA polymerase III PolC-type [bioreactor metagenome]|uniref:DNA polymerase III PolC-type n=1 Tax=bioreactor metagenome TaxID=1076179 RepID=A0A644T5K8_9ZZZZ|nr:3'-5' exonuclease [Candidatus Elulimicrobiales bacterium]
MKTRNLAFIDVETTGTDYEKHEIIELALIVVKQIDREGKGPKIEIVGEYEWKIKPEKLEDAEEEALRINGYNEVDWLFAVPLKNAMEDFNKKAEGCTFVSHNLVFDYNFVDKAYKKTGVENDMHYGKLDTISIAFARLYDVPQASFFTLKYLCEILKVENTKAHTALADTRALVEVYKKLMRAV